MQPLRVLHELCRGREGIANLVQRLDRQRFRKRLGRLFAQPREKQVEPFSPVLGTSTKQVSAKVALGHRLTIRSQ